MVQVAVEDGLVEGEGEVGRAAGGVGACGVEGFALAEKSHFEDHVGD